MASTFWHYKKRATTLNRFLGHAALLPDGAGSPPSLSRHLFGLMASWAMAGPLFCGEAPEDAPPFIAAPTSPTIALLPSSGLTLRWPVSMALPKATGTGLLRA